MGVLASFGFEEQVYTLRITRPEVRIMDYKWGRVALHSPHHNNHLLSELPELIHYAIEIWDWNIWLLSSWFAILENQWVRIELLKGGGTFLGAIVKISWERWETRRFMTMLWMIMIWDTLMQILTQLKLGSRGECFPSKFCSFMNETHCFRNKQCNILKWQRLKISPFLCLFVLLISIVCSYFDHIITFMVQQHEFIGIYIYSFDIKAKNT